MGEDELMDGVERKKKKRKRKKKENQNQETIFCLNKKRWSVWRGSLDERGRPGECSVVDATTGSLLS